MFGYILLIILVSLTLCAKYNFNTKIIGCIIILVTFSSIRYGIGYDYYMYYDLASNYGNSNMREVEIIPSFLLYISSITHPFFFFFVTSFFINYLIIMTIAKTSNRNQDFFLKTLFFIGFPYFYFTSLSIIRNYMAIALLFYVMSMKNKSVILKILIITIAFFCHKSAIVGYLLLIPWNKVNVKYLWLMFFLSFFMGGIIVGIILDSNIESSAFNLLKTYITLEDFYKGGSKVQILIYILAGLSLFKYEKLTQLNDANRYYIALVCIGACLQALFNVSPHLSMRLCIYFFMAILFYITDLFKSVRINLLIQYIICILLFFMYIYVQHVTTLGERANDPINYTSAFPYRTIFSNL